MTDTLGGCVAMVGRAPPFRDDPSPAPRLAAPPPARSAPPLLALAAILAGCSSSGGATTPPPVEKKAARVVRFEASEATVPAGETVTLSWRVEDALEVALTAEPGGPISVGDGLTEGTAESPALTGDTRFVLSARGEDGALVTSTLQVVMLADPEEVAILQLSAEPLTVSPGDRATVTWRVANAGSLWIDASDGSQLVAETSTLSGSAEATIQETTTFTLTARGFGGPKRLSVVVTVDEPPPPPPLEDACADPPRGPPLGVFAEVVDALPRPFIPRADTFRGSGGGLADLDGDGLLDLVLTSRGAATAVFHNRGGLAFDEVEGAGGIDPAPSTGVTLGDLDGDGDPDLFLWGTTEARLYENLGGLEFRRIQSGALSAVPPADGGLLVDLDRDGQLDVLINLFGDILEQGRQSERQLRRDRLLHNTGALVFEDATGLWGLQEFGMTWASVALDLDRDGDLELFLGNDALSVDYGGGVISQTSLEGDYVAENLGPSEEGRPRLVESTEAFGLATRRSSMNVIPADFDEDGLIDLYVSNFGQNHLLLAQPSGGFVERAEALRVDGTKRTRGYCVLAERDPTCLMISWGAVYEDFDNDGSAELLVTNGAVESGGPQPTLAFVRAPGAPSAEFQDRDPELGCYDGRALLPGDLDRDGDLDLVVIGRRVTTRVFEARAPEGNGWLGLRLRGAQSNRDARGALVAVELTSGRRLVRPVGAGGHVHSSLPVELHFGLGREQVAAVTITWPSGQVQDLGPISAGQVLDVEEPTEE